MLKVIGMLLVQVNSTELGVIDKFWDKKLCMKTWYNPKIFMTFADFSTVNLGTKCFDTCRPKFVNKLRPECVGFF